MFKVFGVYKFTYSVFNTFKYDNIDVVFTGQNAQQLIENSYY